MKRRRMFASVALVALGATFIPPADAGTGQQVKRNGAKATSSTPARSSTLALTANDRVLVVANQEADTVSFLQVSDRGQDVFKKLAEIHVGDEPRYVALSPDDREAYVTNSANGTVSVISMTTLSVVTEIAVGLEPRGVVFSPNGTRVFVANQASGTVSVIDPKQRRVTQTLGVGPNPTALAITNDGDRSDTDEVVFVTRFFARRIAGGQGEVSDIGREGVVVAFLLGDPSQAKLIPLSPLADSGFTADRSLFCPQFNANLHNPIFCPNTTVASATDPRIAADPQSVFPNQLGAALIRGGILYLPNIGAQPEPPVRFNLNVQGLVHAVDVAKLEQDQTRHVNINAQIKLETQPANPTQSLARLFSGDMIDIDADPQGRTFLLVSRGGDYVLKAALNSGKLSIGAPTAVKRFRTGHIPTGVVISRSGRRAYTNNSLGFSITAIDLQSDRVIARDVQSSWPPAPGSFDHATLVGKLAFFTALGLPEDGLFGTPLQQIDTLSSRNKASDNAWSSCSSCHPDGLSDTVVWSFDGGPRRSISLAGSFSKSNPGDQRIFNWSAVRGSVTDFNNNARGVQGGTGFAGNPPSASIYNHGIIHGASESLDLMTLWSQTIRPMMLPTHPQANAGRAVFNASCANCHGGAKWTKSQILYRENPAFDKDPGAGGVPVDPGVTNAAAQVISYRLDNNTLTFMHDVGTFDPADPLELRGAGAQSGQRAAGAIGFNVPSLLNVGFTGPYFHDGSASTLDQVFDLHRLGGGTIRSTLSAADLQVLKAFLSMIDGRTRTVRSEADAFRDAVE